jgi:GNAT superfamily N-acetyltransferase
MCDEWMPSLRLRLSAQEFHRLPRHAAYKYEYLNGSAYLSPRPRHCHAWLDLAAMSAGAEPAPPFSLRVLGAEDQAPLAKLFKAAFYRVQPFGSLDEATLRTAAQQCLQRAFTGGDGPWVEPASFVAHVPDEEKLVGAILITLLPGGAPASGKSYQWYEPPPPDLWEQGGGQPHLTWIFVSPFHKETGLGSALLSAAVAVLHARGYKSLWTTFLVGNESSMVWHWRRGFQLLPSRRYFTSE